MSIQSRTGLPLISTFRVRKKLFSIRLNFYVAVWFLTRNKDSVILRLKIDKENKPSPFK